MARRWCDGQLVPVTQQFAEQARIRISGQHCVDLIQSNNLIKDLRMKPELSPWLQTTRKKHQYM